MLTKTHSKKIELVNYKYSGNLHGLKEATFIPFAYQGMIKIQMEKLKITIFDFIACKARELTPKAMDIDARYSSLKNFKPIRDHVWVVIFFEKTYLFNGLIISLMINFLNGILRIE